MGRRLFEDLVVSAGGIGAKRGYALPLSVAIHAALFGIAVIVPVLVSSELPQSVGHAGDILVVPVLSTPAPPPVGGGRPVRVPPRRSGSPVAPAPSAGASAPPVIGDDLGVRPACPGCEPGPAGADGGPGLDVGLLPPGMGIGPAPPPPPPVRPGAGIRPPAKLKDVPPVYPDLARYTGVSGIVILECTIDTAGRVVDARVLRGHPLLDAAALDAVRQWVYRPTLLNGVPVPVILTVTVRFELRR